MIMLYQLLRTTLFRPHAETDWPFQKRMLADSYPLMINSLLATLFFKVAVQLLGWLTKDSRVLGWYSAAYKYVDAVQVIPAYFTLAIFPLMSRYAATSKDSLLRAYRLALKLLVIVAIPLAVLGSSLSTELITILGGSQYLPHAASILCVMIWYMPIGFINSVTQYVLITLDQQRFLTRAFFIALIFNVVANVVLINRFGFMAAAYVAIASELALLIPFYVGIRKHLAALPWFRLLWKQVVSALPMTLILLSPLRRHLALSLLTGIGLYAVGLAVLRVFDEREREVVGSALPLDRIRRRVLRSLHRSVDSGTPQK
jgi:O-antigen/teichoic acid export membrane protein